MKQVLFIGPLINEKFNSIGGTTVLFESEKQFIKRSYGADKAKFIPLNRFRMGILNYLYVAVCAVFKGWSMSKIVLNVNINSLLLVIPLFVYKRKLIVRSFGGNLHGILKQNYFNRQILVRLLKNVNYLCVETQLSKNTLFKEFGFHNLYHLVNHREIQQVYVPRKFEKRVLYFGRVNKDKGISQFLEIARQLDDVFDFSIIGPIDDSNFDYLTNDEIYLGVIDPHNVTTTLINYNILIVPTAFIHEGYPGVILEAMLSGVLVLASNFGSIPEIIEDEVTGVLFKIGDIDEVKRKLLAIDESKYITITQNAFLNVQSNYNTDYVVSKYLSTLCYS
jgi:glycosyltransferase involved in cell wall biosynthesis